MGPLTDRSPQLAGSDPPPGTRPVEGLWPDSPVTADGMRIEPPPSEPVASGTSPAAIAADDPPEDPPGDRPSPHGLTVAPNTWLSVSPFHPYSGVLVLPSTTHPAARSR